jgi:hypothetical protein
VQSVHTEFTRGWRYNVLWSFFALTACGGGSGGQSVSPLAISPSSITLDANMTNTFQASGGQLPYVFTVSSGLGTITSAGAFSVQIQGGFLYVFDSSGLYENQTYLTLPRIDAQTGALDKTFPLLHNNYAGSAITFNGNVGYASVAQFIPGMGDPLSYITKFDATTGAIDTNFHTPINFAQSFVDELLPIGSSLYVVTTSKSLVDDRAADFLARVDAATGTPDASFSVPSSMTNAPMRVLTTTGSDLWVGGDFTQYRGGPGYYFIPIDPVTGAVADPQ